MVLYADEPEWSVNAADFTGSATVVGALFLNNEVTGSDNIVGAFVGDSCRGVGWPIAFNDGWLYFITVYANTNGETVSFRAWISETDTVLSVWETIIYSQGHSFGGPDDPYTLNTYLDHDFPPVLSGIPDQVIHQGESFEVVRLYDHLEVNDPDPIIWHVTGQEYLVVDLTDSVAHVEPVAGWVGTESLVFSAVDDSENGHAGSDTAAYTVLPEDNPPVMAGIPDQTIGINSQFSSFDLNEFLIELDGNDVGFGHSFPEPSEPETDPLWSVDHSDHEFSMSATVLVESMGSIAQGGSHTLAAFAPDGSVRGVSSGVQFNDTWIYFITIYSNTDGDTISFRFFDQELSMDLPVQGSITFVHNAVLGGPDDPLVYRAGFLLVDIDDAGWVDISVSDPLWVGSGTVTFQAQDTGTENAHTATDEAVFTVLQETAPVLSGIPDQYLLPGESFSDIELSDYLEPYDGELSWSVSGQNDISIELIGSLALMTSPDCWFGTESIVFTVTESSVNALFSSDTVIFQILNHVPILSEIADRSISEDMVLELDLIATDVEDDTLTFVSNVKEGDISVSVSGNILTVTPAPDWNGSGQIEVIANDGFCGADTSEFGLSVVPVNDRPVAVLVNDFTSMQGQDLVVDGLGSYDAEGDSLSYSWTVPEELGITVLNEPQISFSVPASAMVYSFMLEVDDGQLVSVPDTLLISVDDLSVNDILPSDLDQVNNAFEDVVIIISLPGSFEVDSISLNYSTAFSGFLSSEMIGDGQRSSSYSFNIPFYMAGLEGLVYFVYVDDVHDNTIITDTTDMSLSFGAGVVGTSMLYSAHPEGLLLGSWRLISFPSILDTDLTGQILYGQLNGAPNETGWRLYGWSGSEWVQPSYVEPGKGYWIKQLEFDDHHLSLGSGRTVDLSGHDVSIGPGWNLVSSPYLFPVHADIDGEIFSELFTYGNSTTEGWLDTSITTMLPWGAYAIFNKTSGSESLRLRPLENVPVSVRREGQAGTWSVKIGVRSGKYADLKNEFGMVASSGQGSDSGYCPEPPTVDKYISLYSEPGPDMGPYDRLTTDLRPVRDSVQVWDLVLETNMGACEATMEMRLSGDLNDDQLWMIDMQNRTLTELLGGQTHQHGVSILSTDLENRYKLVHGSGQDVERIIEEALMTIPVRFSLGNNYPNPFNPVTVIPFSIPEPSIVIINIYDIRGREIDQIANEYLGSGFYTREWNGKYHQGRPVSTGVYYYGLETGSFRNFKKMALIK